MKAYLRVAMDGDLREWPLEIGLPSLGHWVSLEDGESFLVGQIAWFPYGDGDDSEPIVMVTATR